MTLLLPAPHVHLHVALDHDDSVVVGLLLVSPSSYLPVVSSDLNIVDIVAS